MMYQRICTVVQALSIVVACMVAATATSFADDPKIAKQVDAARTKGVEYLRLSQNEDGSWTSSTAPGITGLVTKALLDTGLPADDAMVAKALSHLETFVREDGGIYAEGSSHRNYETSIVLMALAAADDDGKYRPTIAAADRFLRKLQWDEDEQVDASDASYGGAGYGSHQRPDLSNTTFLIEALRTAGASPEDPAIQKALLFVSRTQNLETEFNTTPFSSKVNDGGFYYTPAAGGTSQAGTTPNGGLRSYGSMTYAGLKSMIYAGLTMDDPRAKAAHEWIRRFYTVEENPGLGKQGWFYYLQVFGKTLDVLGEETLVDADGVRHHWREDLSRQLVETQLPNGSWVNSAARWYEGDPNLVTAYALLALQHTERRGSSAE